MTDLQELLTDLPGPDTKARATATARQARLTKPAGSLGRLEEMAIWLAAWQGRHSPTLDSAQVLVFAGNHGVVEHGVSAYPPKVTAQMVANFRSGGAAINQLAAAAGAVLSVIDIELDRPTADFTAAAAMTPRELSEALDIGIAAVPGAADILLLGEMGIGNTTAAAALAQALFGGTADDWVGAGTGVDRDGIRRKAQVVRRAVEYHGAALADPMEALRRLGGRELAAIAGAVAAARRRRIPVVLDGYVATVAAAVLARIDGAALDHCQIAHISTEAGHRRLLDHLGKRPLLDLDMRLGEASGAAVALAVLRGAVAAHNGMATFEEAGVAKKT
jgi:nicotinate-nucleotide--dimethylbenzimidazole phosphoribosyltransferase